MAKHLASFISVALYTVRRHLKTAAGETHPSNNPLDPTASFNTQNRSISSILGWIFVPAMGLQFYTKTRLYRAKTGV
jgi:hypothetical protein